MTSGRWPRPLTFRQFHDVRIGVAHPSRARRAWLLCPESFANCALVVALLARE
jgi:hypothetical protein